MIKRQGHSIDFEIDIVAVRKFGRYGFRIHKCPTLARMGAGSLKSATAQTLLTMALLSALKSATRSACARVFTLNGECKDREQGMSHPRKMKVLVRCSDRVFIEAATDAAHKLSRTKPNRAAKTLWEELAREMRRFSMRFEHVDESKVTACRDWAAKVLPKKTHPCGFPLPEAISTTPETSL
jgi:hypothetical protein